MRYDICLRGVGGQGIITAGILLAEAAILDGKNVVMGQSYSPEVRGGMCFVDLVISDTEIECPEVEQADCMLCLTKRALMTGASRLNCESLLILDAQVDAADMCLPCDSVCEPFIATAKRLHYKYANIIAVAYLAKQTGTVSIASIEEALRKRHPETAEVGMECIRAATLLFNNVQQSDRRRIL